MLWLARLQRVMDQEQGLCLAGTRCESPESTRPALMHKIFAVTLVVLRWFDLMPDPSK